MRIPLLVTAAMAAGLLLPLQAAHAKVKITVDLDAQTMHVEAKEQAFDWKVSSGKAGYETPAGKYGVLWMDKDHHSDEYEQAFMPNSIFFAPGFAIHGFGKSPWGHAASHGCVRLPVAKSAILFELVKAEGADVQIVGGSPANRAVADRIARDHGSSRDGAVYARERGNDPGGYEQQARGDQRADDQDAYDPRARGRAPVEYAPRYDDGRGYIARDGSDEASQAPMPQERAAGGGNSFFGFSY